LRSVLALGGIEVVAEIEQGGDLEAALAATPRDVLLLDLQMEQRTMDQIPELARKTMVVVLTANENVETGLTALRLGARAIVQKRLAIESLMTAIRAGLHRRPGLDAARDARGTGWTGLHRGQETDSARIGERALRGRRDAQRRSGGAAFAQREHGQNSPDQHLSEAWNPRSDRTHPLRDQDGNGDRSRPLKVPGTNSAEE
jgi:DNA-binding response OmpR family regulator